MAEHRVDSTPGTTTDFYSRELPPILTVDPGDTVVVHSLDARGYLERVRVPGEERPRMYPEFRGQGLAKVLVRRVVRGFLERGDTPFLHCYSANVGAIALYESLGFRTRAHMTFTILALA